MRPILLAGLAAALVATVAAPALAQPTARVSGNATVYSGPGDWHRAIGRVADGTQVFLNECSTPSSENDFGQRVADWAGESYCYIGEIGGWVNANMLVGAAAKINATPPVSLTTPRGFGIN